MRGVFAFIIFLVSAQIAYAQSQNPLTSRLGNPLFEAALDYSGIPMQEDCTERPLRPPKYHACRDSKQIYAKALANAKAKHQPLMVIFGFDSCPGCKALHKQVFDPKHPTTHADIVKYLSKPALNAYVLTGQSLKMSVVRIHAKSEHGRALAKSLGILKDGSRLRSPLLVYVNSQTGQRYVAPPTPTPYCDWGADFAAGLEGIGVVQAGEPYVVRKRCG